MFKFKLISFGCLIVFSCFLFSAVALAQSTAATLSGTVTDSSGALIPGANVTISNNATGLQRQTVTNDEGSFTIPLLPPSNYTVTVLRDGFTPAEIREVILNVNDQRSFRPLSRFRFRLKLNLFRPLKIQDSGGCFSPHHSSQQAHPTQILK